LRQWPTPVASGIVARLDRPNGNITGFALQEATLGGKWLELLAEIAPGLKRAAIMFNPDTAPISALMPSFETAARSLKLVPIIAPVHMLRCPVAHERLQAPAVRRPERGPWDTP
jgi:putative ABC transport system substrate-binding protein